MQICNGRAHFYQYDLNQKITSDNFKAGDKIHFYNINQRYALPVLAYEENGKVVADVPNILLTTAYPLIVYRYITEEDASFTKEEYTFQVKARPKPDSYIYEETKLYDLEGAVEVILTKMGITNSYKKIFKTVNELPEVGEDEYVYIVPALDANGRPDNDLCDEYIWTDNKWELIGKHSEAFLKKFEYIDEQINNKVDKIEGKSLSTNDFTDEYKNKLDNLSFELIREYNSLPYRGQENVIYIIPKTEELFRKTVSFSEPFYSYFSTRGIQLTDSEVSELANHSIRIKCYVDLSNVTDYSVNYDGTMEYVDSDGVKRHEPLSSRPFFNISKISYIHGTSIALDDDEIPTIIEGTETFVFEKKLAGYDEYMWINNKWELLGDTAHELAATENPLEFTVTFSDGSVKTIQLVAPIKSGSGEGSVLISDIDSTSQANGKFALSQGYYTHANGKYTHSEGNGGYAIGDYSHNEGYRTTTNELASHAEGQETVADGRYSHAEGKETNSVGYSSHSEGASTIAVGNHSHAEGASTKTIGVASHTEGNTTESVGNYSHAEGRAVASIGESSHIEGGGYYTPLSGYNKYAEEAGLPTIEDVTEPSLVQWEKVWRVPSNKSGKAPEWRFAIAYGKYSHAEGENTLALGSFAHTEGHMNIGKGIASHAEGIYNEAIGKQSHAEGSHTSTQGTASHSEGHRAVSSGRFSHAEGIATNAGATTIGIIDSDALYVGGTVVSNDPKVGIEIKLSGNFYSTVGNSIVVRDSNTGQQFIAQVTKYDKNNKTITVHNEHTGMPINRSVRVFTLYTGVPSADFNKIISCTEDKLCSTLVLDKVFIGNEASELLIKVGNYYYISHILSADWSDNTKTTIVIDRLMSDLTSNFSSVELYISVDETPGTHAEGYATWAKGEYSHAEGLNTRSDAVGSHTEGKSTVTTGEYSHAEGSGSKAGGHWTHAEGSGTSTEGYASHAEGVNTKAIASPSHAEGTGTIADEMNLTAVGQYNVAKASRDKNLLFVVGNGNDDKNRSDAFRVFKDGTVEGQNFKIAKDGTITTKEWANETWILLGDSLTSSTRFIDKIIPTYEVETNNEYKISGVRITSRLPIKPGTIVGEMGEGVPDYNYDIIDDGQGNICYKDNGFIMGSVNYDTGSIYINDINDSLYYISITSYECVTDVNDKRYFELISKKTGITIDNRAVSGTGYMRQSDENTGNTSGAKANAFWNIASSIPYDKSSSPIVTIFGSGNDLLHYSNLGSTTDTDTTTICGCINKTLNNIYAKLPLARVCVVTPTPWKGSTPDKTSGQMANYVNKLIEICQLRGIPCLDLFHESALRPDNAVFRQLAYAEDAGCHLNEVGHKLVAPKFKQALESLIL